MIVEIVSNVAFPMCLDTHRRPSAASALDDEVLFLFTFFLS